MSRRPLIAVTNDDGIHSPGLRAAVEAVLDLGDVLILAPTEQQTAMGRSFWGDRDQQFKPIDYNVGGVLVPAYHIHCSPANTVAHGLDVLCAGRAPDLLVSGINYGENLGMAVTLSGTIGAALQAAAVRIPALAVSLQTDVVYHYRYGELDWGTARHFTRLFAARILDIRLPPDVDVLKVDVPRAATPETPWRITRLSRQSYYAFRVPEPTPSTRIRDKEVVIDVDHAALEPDSDVHAIVTGKVISVTPLSLDLTSRTDPAALRLSLDGEAAR